MTRSRHALKLLGICALALGLMGIAASAASAAPPEWMVNNQNLTTSELLPVVQVKEIEKLANGERHAALLATLLGANIEILCEEAKLINIHLLPGGLLSHGKVHFNKCKTYINGEESEACAPYTESEGKIFPELIETRKGEGEIVLHTGEEAVALLWPLEKTGAFVVILLGEECAAGEELPVVGMLTLKDCNGKFEDEKVEHLIEETLKSTEGGEGLYVFNKAEGHEATLDGSAWVGLVEEHENLTWSGLAD